MVRKLYTVLFYLMLPLILLRLIYRASQSRAYASRITERLGFFNKPQFTNNQGFSGAIWIHSVSVGETIAAVPIVRRLQQALPDTPLVVTTMTPTGSDQVRAQFGDSVFHVYAPYDLPGSIKRFLNTVQPKLLVIMETELWPNMLHFTHQRGIPTVLANARLSEKSARGYRRFSSLSHSMLQNLSMVAAQHQSDADRFLKLGLPAANVEVTGSIKFDLKITPQLKHDAAALKTSWSDSGRRLIWVAASTHEGEDETILQAFQQVLSEHPRLLLVLVPRHLERFNKVTTLCQQHRLNTMRRSQLNLSTPATVLSDTQVIVGDTMGELLTLYGCADITLVGGSLIPHGGHNTLEPAAWGLPIVTGETDFNFAHITRLLQQAGALVKVTNATQLAQQIGNLASQPALREKMGSAALSVVECNRGALEHLLNLLANIIKN